NVKFRWQKPSDLSILKYDLDWNYVCVLLTGLCFFDNYIPFLSFCLIKWVLFAKKLYLKK
ncbi:MAG: hypothetical protein Q8Q33_09665, partial [Chlamydiota bacterium]|nr:hypothetical protein [Chlamydiota bacterium]